MGRRVRNNARPNRKTPPLEKAQREFKAVEKHKNEPTGSWARERYIVALDNLITAEKKHG